MLRRRAERTVTAKDLGMAKGKAAHGSKRSTRGETERIIAWSDVILAAIPWVGWALIVAAMWIPLHEMRPMVEDVAGKKTDVTLTFSFSVAINIMLGGAYLVQRRKLKRQRDELIRIRSRLEAIDEERLKEPLKKGKGK
jgi:hypothetical protein